MAEKVVGHWTLSNCIGFCLKESLKIYKMHRTILLETQNKL